MTALALTVAALLVLASALLSASTAAVFSLTHSSLRTLEDEGFRFAPLLVTLRRSPGPVHATVLFLNTVLNVLAAGIAVADATLRAGLFGASIALPASAVVIYLFGELVPRASAARRPVRLALGAAPILLALTRALKPLVGPLEGLGVLFFQRDEPAGSTREEREVMEMSAIGQEEGVVGDEERRLVERAFRLDELTVWDVMTPRVDIAAWKDSRTLAEIIDELSEVPFSRIPVYGESVDTITGVLYVREAYQFYAAGHRDVPLSRMAREPYFVPGSMSLNHLLKNFQVRRLHLGIVADEFGGTDGLVTLEDVLEELVGEIVDETDVDEEELVRVSRTEIVVDAGIDLREINDAFNVALPQVEFRSLNGLILEELGHVPDKGDLLRMAGLEIEMLEATDTQVLRARLTKVVRADEQDRD